MRSLIISVTALIFLFSSCSRPEIKEEAIQTQISENASSMFLENESIYNFTETIEKLNLEIEKTKWKAVAVHDLQESIKKSGTDVLPVQVFVLCQANYASKILIIDDERIFSSILPCRVSVYEKSNGLTYISRMDMDVFAKSMRGEAEKAMLTAYVDIEEVISSLIVTE